MKDCYGNPFELGHDDRAYRLWRDAKLARLEKVATPSPTSIAAEANISPSSLESLKASLDVHNLAVFRTEAPLNKSHIVKLGDALGLQHLDGNLCSDEDNISSITVAQDNSKATYIPYTNKPIGWHTDGYYNEIPAKTIKSFILYCVSNASQGGANKVLDHELAYIYLRDLDPRYIQALSHPQALTIPANTVGGETIRPEQTGPVFSVLPESGALHMRYTIRHRNVIWRKDPALEEATSALKEFLHSDYPAIFDLTLQPGEGIIANNVLHMRTAFEDGDEQAPNRLLYRARYFDRIATDTGSPTPC